MTDDSDVEERLRRLEETVDELKGELEALREEVDTEGFSDSADERTVEVEPSRSSGVDGRVGQPDDEEESDGQSESDDSSSSEAAGSSGESETSEAAERSAEVREFGGGGEATEETATESVGTQLLNYVGIGLLFLGVVFLFDYAIEQGWLTEWVRVGIGGLLGTGLLAGGLQLRDERSALAGVLSGGGLATYYTTVYGAFQLYQLIPFAAAFALMVGVTMLAFVLALRFESVGLALVGTIGGYATPFLLATGSKDVVGLLAYTSVVTAGTAAIYLYRRWSGVLAIELAGHWLVMGIALAVGEPPGDWSAIEQVMLHLGVAVGWGVTGVLPLLRARLIGEGAGSSELPVWLETMRWLVDRVAVVVTPLLAFGLLQVYWDLSETALGAAACGLAVVYAGGHVVLRRLELEDLASALLWVVLFGATFGVVEIADGLWLELGLAAEAFLLIWLGARDEERVLQVGAGLVGAMASIQVGWLLMEDVSMLQFGGHVVALGLLFSTARRFDSEFVRVTGGVVVYVLVLHLLGSGLSQLANGEAWVTGSWAVFGFLLVGLGAHEGRQFDHSCGLVVVAVVVGKLFFVDLEEVEALWRIMLFLGVGGLFLAVSYLFPEIVSLDVDEESDSREDESA